MSAIWKYKNLRRLVRNWPVYFKRKYIKSNLPAIYRFRKSDIRIQVPDQFFYVFKEVIMEDFYRLRTLLPHVPDKPVIVDIGANAGYFSFLMAALRTAAEIYAYEPIPNNTNVFNANLKLNADVDHHIRFQQRAVT